MALSENYRTETIGRLSADKIVRWDYRPNPRHYKIVYFRVTFTDNDP